MVLDFELEGLLNSHAMSGEFKQFFWLFFY